MASQPKEFTRDGLSSYDGKEGRSVYIAHEGKVYDASTSKLWKTGTHMKRHQAGRDLSADIKAAPHDASVLGRFPQVGILRPEKDPMDEKVPDVLLALFRRLPILRRHPHPMTVHFPIAFFMLVPVLNVLSLVTGKPSLETSAFHVLTAGLIATPIAMLTGPYNWWMNYAGKWTYIIAVKMISSLVLIVLVAGIFLWRVIQPTIMLEPGGARILYLLFTLGLPPVVTILGWFGAKMTFPV
jgi:predicted heme/steroid binding protein/uncharacterized membrane protein